MRISYPSTAQFKEALVFINNAVAGEKSDAAFYEWLLQNIPDNLNEAERADIISVIQGIASDERLHNEIFKSMYRQLTGRDTTPPAEEAFIPPAGFKEGIIRAIKDETEAVRRYRRIRAGLPDNAFRDQVFSILTDEIRHGILYNYIYTTIQNT